MLDILKDKKFYILWLISILGSVSVLPYAAALGKIAITPNIIIAALIQSAFLFGLAIFFGLKLSKKLGFKIIPSDKFIIPSITSGIALGLVLKFSDKFIFTTSSYLLTKQLINVEAWQGMLASIYGAVNEEILLRLFLVSLFAFLLQKFSKIKKSKCIIASILFCSLIFGLGHLPALYKILETPHSWDILRVLTLNGLAGVVFGLLYWRYGLMASMLSHFVADLLIHVF